MALLKKSGRLVASVPAYELTGWLNNNQYPAAYFDIEFAATEMSDIDLDTAIKNGWSDIAWHHIRALRDTRLAACDYTQMPDCPLTAEQKQAWADYRQALRNLPASQSNPALIAWPTPPNQEQ